MLRVLLCQESATSLQSIITRDDDLLHFSRLYEMGSFKTGIKC